ncbi:hypothetical protein FQG30_19690 [Escherichia coli]|nr:hypothetical protein [Escherichia coli]
MLKLQDPGFGTRRYSDDAYDWPIASTTEVAAAMDEGWNFAVQNPEISCDRIYPMMIDMLDGKKD